MELLNQTFNSIDERNQRSSNSKLRTIKQILGVSTGLPMEEIWKRQKLLRCLEYHRYKEFQEMIGMPLAECDGRLGNSTLVKLKAYLRGIQAPSSIIRTTRKEVKTTLMGEIVNRNETNKNSKLTEIRALISQDNGIGIYKKLKLEKLLFLKKYVEFQQEIGMEKDKCDGKLGKTTLETLKFYLKLDKTAIEGKAYFHGKPLYEISSHKLMRDPETGKFCCSKTAWFNGRQFGVSLPRGNAYEALTHPGRTALRSIPQNKKYKQPKAIRPAVTQEDFLSVKKNINFVDFCTYTKSKFGHRAVGFRDDKGEWYILDPYTKVNGRKNESPKKLEDYLKRRKIVKAHFYHSSGYTKEQ